MQTVGDAPTRTWRPTRLMLWGFIIGAAITVPAAVFALLVPAGEALQPYLVPGTHVLRPLADVVSTWPGIVNMAIASAVNGVVYAIGAVALGYLARPIRCAGTR